MLKKYSIGISLINCSKDEWFEILQKYKDSISYVYYSPNSFEFFSRRCDESTFDNVNDNEQYLVLERARQLGIKTELAINARRDMNESDVEFMLKKEKEKHIPDYVVTYTNYVNVVSSVFPECELTLSYNEGIMSESDLYYIDKRFSTIILGNRWLRNKSIFKKAHMLGFKVELLVNNGCVHNCTYCFSKGSDGKGCETFFDSAVKRADINQVLAICSVSKDEIFEHFENWNLITNYKISTRPFSHQRVSLILDYYLGESNLSDNPIDLVDQLVCLRHYGKYLPQVDKDSVLKLKQGLWKE